MAERGKSNAVPVTTPNRMASFGGRRPGLNGNGTGYTDDGAESGVEASRYVGVSVGVSSGMGYWVECDLPAYKGLYVLYRTNNHTAMRRLRPVYAPPASIRENDRQIALLGAMIVDEVPAGLDLAGIEAFFKVQNEIEDKRLKLIEENTKAVQEYGDEFYKRQAHWLSKYVLDFDPWPFSDVPKPDQSDPDSYLVLQEQLEDLFRWLPNRGYDLALEASAKNS